MKIKIVQEQNHTIRGLYIKLTAWRRFELSEQYRGIEFCSNMDLLQWKAKDIQCYRLPLQQSIKYNVLYLYSKSKGEPQSWQPVQMRSSNKLVSPVLYNLLLINIFSFSESPRGFWVNGRKISPTDAWKTALQELDRWVTSERE